MVPLPIVCSSEKTATALFFSMVSMSFFASSLVVPGVPKKYKVELKKIAIPRRQSRTKITEQLTEESTRLLEAAIRSNPDQYLWHHRRWKNGVEWLRKEGYSC